MRRVSKATSTVPMRNSSDNDSNRNRYICNVTWSLYLQRPLGDDSFSSVSVYERGQEKQELPDRSRMPTFQDVCLPFSYSWTNTSVFPCRSPSFLTSSCSSWPSFWLFLLLLASLISCTEEKVVGLTLPAHVHKWKIVDASVGQFLSLECTEQHGLVLFPTCHLGY